MSTQRSASCSGRVLVGSSGHTQGLRRAPLGVLARAGGVLAAGALLALGAACDQAGQPAGAGASGLPSGTAGTGQSGESGGSSASAGGAGGSGLAGTGTGGPVAGQSGGSVGGADPGTSGAAGAGGTAGQSATGGSGGTTSLPPITFKKKNVLLIMVDDMNDWAEPFGGHPQSKTPNIKKLAARGVVFKSAHAAVPVCNPSRTSMLLGMRPHDSTIWGNSDPHYRTVAATADRVTLPQYFMNQGYQAAVAGKIFHETMRGDAESWNAVFAGPRGTIIPANFKPNHTMVFEGYEGTFPWGLYWGATTDGTDKQGDWAGAGYVADLLSKPQSKPFFFAYGGMKPHLSWLAPQKYYDMFPLETIQTTDVDPNDLADVPQEGKSFSNQAQLEFVRTQADNNWKKAIQAHLASQAFADECVGRVLDALDRSPYKNDTIVLLMGDHGWHLGEKNHWGKATLWEEATTTPLIIYDPSINRPGTVSEPVSLQDLYPTLIELNALNAASLSLTGKPDAAPLAGHSLVPYLLDPARTDRHGWALSSWQGGHEAMRTKHWGLIRHAAGKGFSYELYDMLADQLQRTNLASKPEQANRVQALSAFIDTVIKTNGPSAADFQEP